VQKELETRLLQHEKDHPQIIIHTLNGEVIPEGTPIADLVLPGGVQELAIHPESAAARAPEAA